MFLKDNHILILSLVSLVAFNLYSTLTTTFYFETYAFFIKQSVFMGLGLFVGFLLYIYIAKAKSVSLALKKFYIVNFAFIAFTVFLSLLLFVLPETYLPTINGAKRWIKFMGLTIAPIEITKLSYVFIFTHIFSSARFEKNKNTTGIGVFIPIYMLFTVYLVVITYKQKDLGNFFLFSSVFVTMLILFFNRLRVVFKMFGLGIVMLGAMIASSSHRRDRIMQWFESTSDTGNVSANYQVEQGFFAINEGGYFGVGPGQGIMKLGYIPEPHTDMVITILLNELGLFGFCIYILSFFGLLYYLIKKSVELNNLYLLNYTMLSSLLFAYQIIINLYGVTGIIPLKGINVPFLSYGGSSAMSIFVLLFLNFALVKVVERRAAETGGES